MRAAEKIMTLRFDIPRQEGDALSVNLDAGDVLFILGANGTGKSSLVQQFYVEHREIARRMSAHRQTWFDSGAVALTGQQRRTTGQNIKSWDSDRSARWREIGTAERASLAVYDLVDAENVRAREITGAVDADKIEEAIRLRTKEAPLKVLNEIFRMSGIPIEISLRVNEELVASKRGGPFYSIAELSDGERNVLLIAATVLTAKSGTVFLIDEPERHIHRSISSPLLSMLFARRTDCVFVVSTHEVMLPIDNPASKTILLRSNSRKESGEMYWDADLLEAPHKLDNKLMQDILGSRRRMLFVEGTEGSLDLPLYGLLFPDVSVVAKSSCRDVEHAVVGITESENLHWVSAFGIIDQDGRSPSELEKLKQKRVYALNVFSVESIYYHPEIQKRLAARQASVLGGNPEELLHDAKQAALAAIAVHKKRLSERVTEKAVRDSILKKLPRREDISKGVQITITEDVAAAVQREQYRMEKAIEANDLTSLIARYPVRETSALAEIAKRLKFQDRNQYEGAAIKLLMDDSSAIESVRALFDSLCEDMAERKEA